MGWPCSGVRPSSLSSVRRPQFQRSSPLKLLDRSKPNIMWSILRRGGNETLYKWSRSHDQDGRHAHICLKKRKQIFFSGTGGLISTKLGV